MLTDRVLSNLQLRYISELTAERQPAYNLRSADDNFLFIPLTKQSLHPGFRGLYPVHMEQPSL